MNKIFGGVEQGSDPGPSPEELASECESHDDRMKELMLGLLQEMRAIRKSLDRLNDTQEKLLLSSAGWRKKAKEEMDGLYAMFEKAGAFKKKGEGA